MPKGVEHWQEHAERWEPIGLFSPLMPKGVEHACTVQMSRAPSRLFSPLMPKGVEHYHSIFFMSAIAFCFPL